MARYIQINIPDDINIAFRSYRFMMIKYNRQLRFEDLLIDIIYDDWSVEFEYNNI